MGRKIQRRSQSNYDEELSGLNRSSLLVKSREHPQWSRSATIPNLRSVSTLSPTPGTPAKAHVRIRCYSHRAGSYGELRTVNDRRCTAVSPSKSGSLSRKIYPANRKPVPRPNVSHCCGCAPFQSDLTDSARYSRSFVRREVVEALPTDSDES